ncbi:hypothetical protein [Desulfoplanes formicivorans]|uniref:ResB-like domain-containing protein n=1 Tax=Desulfoplanes formicivorans TaxID=1592317 RepID=A0A194ADI0_9BACT|nr:hypothetical protein [Desulfoplanes formicivorans]GAU07403.1 hypothetical protein DPF_0081 [Desulfoplanes formicivorans]
MLKRLSSMYFAFWAITALVLWMGLGALLASKGGPYYDLFKELNEQMIATWLVRDAQDQPIIAGWFAGLCLIAGALLLNTGLCIWQRIVPMFHAGRMSRNLLAVMHILVILVMLGHGLSMIVGDKYANKVMFPGQTIAFGDGYTLRMDSLVFVDDPTLLRLPQHDKHMKMTRDAVHMQDNQVTLTLSKNNQVIARPQVKIMEPFDHGSLHVVLKTFVWPKNKNHVGAVMIIVRNPLATLFFIIYALMIATLGWYVIITWKKPLSRRHANQLTQTAAT